MTEEKKEIHRGDIYFADLSPTVGCEKGGIKVPIKQNDIGNLSTPTVIVAPITGRAKKWLPIHVILHCTGLNTQRKSNTSGKVICALSGSEDGVIKGPTPHGVFREGLIVRAGLLFSLQGKAGYW